VAPERELVLGLREGVFDRSPHELLVQDHVRAVRRMHQRRAGRHRLFRIDHVRQRLVLDFDQLRRVLGERARVGDHRSDPFAGVADDAVRQREARELRCVDAG